MSLSSSSDSPAALPPFSQSPASARAQVQQLFFDVDDTLTWEGHLPAAACASLYRAADAGLELVAVTGRSASWAEMLLRLFPLRAAVAETGAMAFVKGPTGLGAPITVLHSEPDPARRRENDALRMRVAEEVKKRHPEARLALDNMGRVYDTAFDLVEEGPPISEATAQGILSIVRDHGLNHARSSVHINVWVGTFNKRQMVERLLQEALDQDPAQSLEKMVYVGDSTNDGAMFAATPLSVGVANVAPHLETLRARDEAPAWGVSKNGGHGFVQVVDALLQARG
jgi:HAD superfamily hydrolase (TIGR01484 family)